jgi:hypothetical protein
MSAVHDTAARWPKKAWHASTNAWTSSMHRRYRGGPDRYRAVISLWIPLTGFEAVSPP